MKRFRIVIVFAVVTVLGGLAVAIFRTREPRYQGRALSEWLFEADVLSDISIIELYNVNLPADRDAAWQSSSHAVKQIGTNGISCLLKWIRVKDSPAKAKMIRWFAWHPSFHVRIWPAYFYHSMAELGFQLLGAEAKPAWPTLIQWTSGPDPERRYWALRCLAATRPDKEIILPVLRRALQDPDRAIQIEAASTSRYLNLNHLDAGTNRTEAK